MSDVQWDGQIHWHGQPTGMTASQFRSWRWWMLEHQAGLYFAWARVLVRQEIRQNNQQVVGAQ